VYFVILIGNIKSIGADMPVIRLEYDNAVVNEEEAQAICDAAQKVVSDTTSIKEVFVYGNSSHIKVKIAPIEIWVEMSDHKITDADTLAKDIREGLSTWKSQTNFPHLINLTLVPMHWKLELDI
jgi:hypothetical protein